MKNIRSILSALLITILLTPSALASEPEPPEVEARAAILMDADSGLVLFEKNADEPMLIASTTKIMTALLALERCDSDQTVVIDPAWTGVEGSTMYLEAGQEMTVRELLYGLMLASGNDAAVALACIAAGSVEAFVSLMNERAAALGCENTHFENPNGLDGEAHYSSARDMATITRDAIRNEGFCEIASTTTKAVGGHVFTNHNRLLTECEGVFGVKTGYTEAAGRTLVTCCERNELRLICVTLSDPNDWCDHTNLYDWGYGSYFRDELLQPPETVWSIPVIGGTADSVSVSPALPLTVLRRADQEVSVELRLPPFVYAEVESGAEAGQAAAVVDGSVTASVPLVFSESVNERRGERIGFLDWLLRFIKQGERKIYSLS